MTCKNMHSKLEESSLETFFWGKSFQLSWEKLCRVCNPELFFWHLSEISHKSFWLLHIHCIMCR
jgi:hypothetical protein